jgi:hypothetical protein
MLWILIILRSKNDSPVSENLLTKYQELLESEDLGYTHASYDNLSAPIMLVNQAKSLNIISVIYLCFLLDFLSFFGM